MSLTPQQMIEAVLAIPGGSSSSGGLQIVVNAPAGATVTAAKNGHTYAGNWDSTNSHYIIAVPEYGSYVVTATKNGNSNSKTVSIAAESTDIPILPNEFIRLDYIEGTGTQYLDIGLPEAFKNHETERPSPKGEGFNS